jgi:hypothetical protein
MLARQHDIGQERDDGGIGKTLAEYFAAQSKASFHARISKPASCWMLQTQIQLPSSAMPPARTRLTPTPSL